MFTFLHAADIHLDSPLLKLEQYDGAPTDALRGATRRALENLTELAVSKAVNFVLIAGDVYDGDWKDYNTGLFFVSQMARFREAGIPVFMIAGNHDAASRMSKSLRLPDTVTVFPPGKPDTELLDDIRVAVHGQSFSSPAVKKNLAARYPRVVPDYFNIGLLHTGLTGREGHESYAPCTLEDLTARDYDYWALGHVHRREIVSETPWAVFPGNIQGRHIRETGPKGCMLVTVDDDGDVSPEFHSLDVIRWVRAKVDISGAPHPYKALETVGDRLATALEENDGLPLAVRVELSGETPAHEALAADPEQWLNHIRAVALDTGNGQIWIEKFRLNTRSSAEEAGEKAPDGPVSEITALFDEMLTDPEMRAALEKPLEDLFRKLPREFRDQSELFRPDNPEATARMIESVRPMLLHRLLFKGGEE